MKEKPQTLKNIERYKSFMDIRVYVIQTLRSDHGSEFAPRDIKDYIRAKAIAQTPTSSATHA